MPVWDTAYLHEYNTGESYNKLRKQIANFLCSPDIIFPILDDDADIP